MVFENPNGTKRPPAEARLQIMLFGFCLTQMLYVAAKLRIADRLQGGSQDIDELARSAGADRPALARLMRVLVAAGVFREERENCIGLTSLGERLISDAPNSISAVAIALGEEAYQAYAGLLHTVRTGEAAFDHVFGRPYYEYLTQEPEAAAIFNQWMHRTAEDWLAPFVKTHDFGTAGRIVDVGGGDGTLLAAVLSAHPAARGLLYDLPHAAGGAAALLESAGVADRCQIVIGDFLSSVPTGGDTYILARVLLNWDDDRALTILRNCHCAMRQGTRLLVVDFVVPPGEVPLGSLINDINLMVLFPGARQRSETEITALLSAAGFTVSSSAGIGSHPLLRVIEGYA